MKHKRRLNIKKVFLSLFIVVFMSYFIFQNVDKMIHIVQILFKDSIALEYDVIKEDQNDQYSGKGQEKIENKDGYFTTFTTSNNKIYKEYKQNDASWQNHSYWQDNMAESGCGITAMSIVLSGYSIDKTPEDLRKQYMPVLKGEKISSELKRFGILNSDFYFDQIHLSKESLKQHLLTNRPIIVCVWNKPDDNRWTTSSHYMVLLASEGDNKVYISNPNGGKNDAKSSGWYTYDEIQPYIAKALYIESE